MKNQIRIIGGSLRGRNINFPSKKDLRPTPNRVRETLFNWLAPHIIHARCLELFAGSAALSFESISRQANSVTVVENDKDAIQHIKANRDTLKVSNMEIIPADCLHWLKETTPETPYNIVFVDPPYALPVLPQCFKLLTAKPWLADNAIIYFEINKPLGENDLPEHWTILKNKKAGQVYYYLVENSK